MAVLMSRRAFNFAVSALLLAPLTSNALTLGPQEQAKRSAKASISDQNAVAGKIMKICDDTIVLHQNHEVNPNGNLVKLSNVCDKLQRTLLEAHIDAQTKNPATWGGNSFYAWQEQHSENIMPLIHQAISIVDTMKRHNHQHSPWMALLDSLATDDFISSVYRMVDAEQKNLKRCGGQWRTPLTHTSLPTIGQNFASVTPSAQGPKSHGFTKITSLRHSIKRRASYTLSRARII